MTEPSTIIGFLYRVVNSGHESDIANKMYNEARDAAADIVAGVVTAQTGIPVPTQIIELASWLSLERIGLNLLTMGIFADCDGVCAADQFAVTSDMLRSYTSAEARYAQTREYIGYNSPDGCGDNSKYRVTFSVNHLS